MSRERTKNQEKATIRNYAIMQSVGMITRITQIRNSTLSSEVYKKCNRVIESLNDLREAINMSNTIHWKKPNEQRKT